MTTKTIQQPTANTEVTKPATKGIKLDLDQVLTQVWNQGLPNGIMNAY